MADRLSPSPGLAVNGESAPKLELPNKAERVAKKRGREANPPGPLRRLTLDERAKALKEKKTPKHRLMLHLTDSDYDTFLTICERQVEEPASMGLRLLRSGMKRYGGVRPPDPEEAAIGDELPLAFDQFGAEYRERVREEQGPEAEQMKALVRGLGIQTT